MNFYSYKETRLNYKRNQVNHQKIAFNLIEYLKKPVNNLKKTNPLGESRRKLLLIKSKFSLDEIFIGFISYGMSKTIEFFNLGVKQT